MQIAILTIFWAMNRRPSSDGSIFNGQWLAYNKLHDTEIRTENAAKGNEIDLP